MVTAELSAREPAPPRVWPNPVQAGDHYLLGKLHTQLLPWLVASGQIKKRWFVVVSTGYAYLGDIGAALAGLGIGAPLIGIAQNGVKAGTSLPEALGAGPWTWLGIVGLIGWALIRLVVQREDVNSRANAARGFIIAMNGLNLELHQALSDPDPMPKVASIQQRINTKVSEAMQARIWDWNPLPDEDDSAYHRELAASVARIRTQYMGAWTPVPTLERANG